MCEIRKGQQVVAKFTQKNYKMTDLSTEDPKLREIYSTLDAYKKLSLLWFARHASELKYTLICKGESR